MTPGMHARRGPRPGPPPQGAEPNYKNPRSRRWREPPDHALGRSRGGISTKIHQLVDGRGRPLVIDVTAGQSGDSTMLAPLLSRLAVARPGRGRPRTRPVAVLADKAYSSPSEPDPAALPRHPGRHPQPSDQVSHRLRRGSAGGRPPAFDPDTYKSRNVVERSFNDHKQWRGIATRYDKLAATYRGGVVLRAITLWLNHLGDMP